MPGGGGNKFPTEDADARIQAALRGPRPEVLRIIGTLPVRSDVVDTSPVEVPRS